MTALVTATACPGELHDVEARPGTRAILSRYVKKPLTSTARRF